MRLFRYRRFNPAFLQSELEGKVYVWHLDEQNDPFEGQFRCVTAPTVEGILQLFKRLQEELRRGPLPVKDKAWIHDTRAAQAMEAARLLRDASDGDLRHRAQAAFAKVYENPAHLEEIARKHRKMVHRTVIACFAAAELSPTMFAHYGDGHAGFCIEYEVDEGFVSPVLYEAAVPAMSLFAADPGAIVRTRLLTKHTDWRYEREHRLVLYDRPVGPFGDPGIRVTNVYAGFKIKPAHLEQIMARRTALGAAFKLWQVEPKEAEYAFGKRLVAG